MKNTLALFDARLQAYWQHHAACNPSPAADHEILQQVHQLPNCLRQDCILARCKGEVKHCVRSYQRSIGMWLNFLAVQGILQEPQILLSKALLQVYTHILQQYACFIDTNLPLPSLHQSVITVNLLPRWEKCIGAFSECCIDQWLLDLLQQPFRWLYNQCTVTQAQVSYFEQMLSFLESATVKDTGGLTTILYRVNFNEPLFIQYLLSPLQEQLKHAETMAEKQCCIREFREQYLTQVILLPEGWRTSLPCCREQLVQQLDDLESSLQLLPATLPAKEVATTADHLATALSVPQLAVWVRLLLDTCIIRYDNQREFLRKVAQLFQTPKVAMISPESLRVKYYSPDTAAKNIVHEYLVRMLQLLKTY